jgi:predicted aspartyl protease
MSHYLYSSDYFPAAPVTEIRLGAAGTKPVLGPFVALIDTGSDATAIPLAYLRQVGATKVDQAIIRSQWGERRHVNLYSVAIQIDQHYFPAVWVVGDTLSDELILGRNLLNRLLLLLDGPAATTEVLAEVT